MARCGLRYQATKDGRALTADTSGISDANGLNNVSYQYQWLRDDADIAGQTNSTYRLVSADEGKTIKVQVTFNDDAGNAESLTSTATTAVAARPAETPVDLLTASFANVPADHNGENFTFQLNFSENVEAGYARIRDHALTVTGGSIANASRITQGSNQGWNVEVDPTGNGSVTITLPGLPSKRPGPGGRRAIPERPAAPRALLPRPPPSPRWSASLRYPGRH